jgi:hypothetical protein
VLVVLPYRSVATKVDYDDHQSLVTALMDQDALVITYVLLDPLHHTTTSAACYVLLSMQSSHGFFPSGITFAMIQLS